MGRLSCHLMPIDWKCSHDEVGWNHENDHRRYRQSAFGHHPVGLIQVVGHTPVPTVTNVDSLWFCDTMSTLPNGLPIGDGSMLLYTPGTEPIFNVVQATL